MVKKYPAVHSSDRMGGILYSVYSAQLLCTLLYLQVGAHFPLDLEGEGNWLHYGRAENCLHQCDWESCMKPLFSVHKTRLILMLTSPEG